MLFHQKTRNTVKKYHRVRAEPPFTAKTIEWEYKTGPRRCQSLCKRWELFFKPGV